MPPSVFFFCDHLFEALVRVADEGVRDGTAAAGWPGPGFLPLSGLGALAPVLSCRRRPVSQLKSGLFRDDICLIE